MGVDPIRSAERSINAGGLRRTVVSRNRDTPSSRRYPERNFRNDVRTAECASGNVGNYSTQVALVVRRTPALDLRQDYHLAS